MPDTHLAAERRIEELEGLLASTTARLEDTERELRDAEIDRDTAQRIAARVENLEIDVGQSTVHLAALDRAIERVGTTIATAGAEADWWVMVEAESRLSILCSAALTLAAARDKVTPKPAPR